MLCLGDSIRYDDPSLQRLLHTMEFVQRQIMSMFGPIEVRIAWFLSSFDTAKERLKRLVQILHHRLQYVAVDRTSVGIRGFVGFHLSPLFVFADGALFLLIGSFALCETTVVPDEVSQNDGKQVLIMCYLSFVL